MRRKMSVGARSSGRRERSGLARRSSWSEAGSEGGPWRAEAPGAKRGAKAGTLNYLVDSQEAAELSSRVANDDQSVERTPLMARPASQALTDGELRIMH